MRINLPLILALIASPHLVGAAAIQLPVTGQVACFSPSGTPVSCTGTGQDGQLRKGVQWPSPRLIDNGDGTVRDELTGLIWLRNGGCLPSGSWTAALEAAASLRTGQCGLADNSGPGDWRLPNVTELESLIDLSRYTPALPVGHPFVSLDSSFHWTSSTHAHYTANAWAVNLYDGTVGGDLKTVSFHVLPVRGGR